MPLDLGALRAVSTVVDTHLAQIFPDDKPRARPPLGLDEQVATGAFSPGITRLMSSVQTIAMREGLILQAAVHQAHTGDPNLFVRWNCRFAIGEGDRALVAANHGIDLGCIEPPAASETVGRREIDVLVFDDRSKVLRLIDIKRAPCPGDRAHDAMAEAALAARRQLARFRIAAARTEIVILRWLADPAEARAHGYVTRETVDAALGRPVRALVDAGIRRFREGLDERFLARQREVFEASLFPEPTAPAPDGATPTDRARREALMRAFETPRGRTRAP